MPGATAVTALALGAALGLTLRIWPFLAALVSLLFGLGASAFWSSGTLPLIPLLGVLVAVQTGYVLSLLAQAGLCDRAETTAAADHSEAGEDP